MALTVFTGKSPVMRGFHHAGLITDQTPPQRIESGVGGPEVER
jgi:hypothetical protein